MFPLSSFCSYLSSCSFFLDSEPTCLATPLALLVLLPRPIRSLPRDKEAFRDELCPSDRAVSVPREIWRLVDGLMGGEDGEKRSEGLFLREGEKSEIVRIREVRELRLSGSRSTLISFRTGPRHRRSVPGTYLFIEPLTRPDSPCALRLPSRPGRPLRLAGRLPALRVQGRGFSGPPRSTFSLEVRKTSRLTVEADSIRRSIRFQTSRRTFSSTSPPSYAST